MKCLRCSEDKERKEFAWKNKTWNIRVSICRKCQDAKPATEPKVIVEGTEARVDLKS